MIPFALKRLAHCRLAERCIPIVIFALQTGCLVLLAFSQACFAGDVDTTGMISGSVIETEREIIVEGARFVVEGEQKTPVISVKNGSRKKVILNGVEIIARNTSYRSNDGAAGLVVIDNENDDSKVVIKNLQVRARNTKVSSTTTGSSSCAAAICYKVGQYDSTRSMTVTASGQTNISASQGQRPDYRKIQAR